MLEITLIILFIIVIVVVLLLKRTFYKKDKLLPQSELDPFKISINDIDRMEDGSDFEMYLYRLFVAVGYEAYKTVGSRDFGADLVFTDREGYRNVIQAKRYSETNPVGLEAVQQVFSSMRYYKAKKSIVVTSGRYTDACETLAGVNAVKLLNRADLISIIDLFKDRHFDKVKDIIEAEPRIIYESWKEYKTDNKIIKKDKKAEKLITHENKYFKQ